MIDQSPLLPDNHYFYRGSIPQNKGGDRHFAFPLLFGLALTAPFWARRRPFYYPYPLPRPYPYLYPYYPSPYFYYNRIPYIYY